MLYKETIKRNFSRYAHLYDKYAAIQKFSALKLGKMLNPRNFTKILDIGCGTGTYTKILRERFPFAEINAIDISKRMLEIAKEKLKDDKIDFVVGDAESINLKKRFDLVTSNATMQWFEDLEEAIFKYKNLLFKDGVILFSIFGPLTFYELNWSLKKISGRDAVDAVYFNRKEKMLEILKKFFRKAIIEQRLYRERNSSLTELLKKIRYTGVRGNGMRETGLWTPKRIANLEGIYKKEFKEIVATYEILFCKGIG